MHDSKSHDTESSEQQARNGSQRRIGGRHEADFCKAWSLLLPDAYDGSLGQAEQQALEAHLAVCSICSQQSQEMEQGAAWLSLLQQAPPQPAHDLLSSILALTSGAKPQQTSEDLLPHLPSQVPVLAGTFGETSKQIWGGERPWMEPLHRFVGHLPPVRQRLAMTAATAFFSLCLVSNMLGFSASPLHAQSLRPATLQRTVIATQSSWLHRAECLPGLHLLESGMRRWLGESGQSERPEQ